MAKPRNSWEVPRQMKQYLRDRRRQDEIENGQRQETDLDERLADGFEMLHDEEPDFVSELPALTSEMHPQDVDVVGQVRRARRRGRRADDSI